MALNFSQILPIISLELVEESVMEKKIKVGISSCLLGVKVRYDGGHKRSQYVNEVLSEYFDWVPSCPEVAIGLPTPRDSIQLKKIDGKTRLYNPKSDTDLTEKMEEYSEKRVSELKDQEIYGYILKAKSPSCGMERVKIYKGHAIAPDTKGVGVFAKALLNMYPNLPVEEEGRLMDPHLRENWISRVFAYYSFRTIMYPEPRLGKLVGFHSQYKFKILSHCQASYRELGRIVANGKSKPIEEVLREYEDLFMEALSKRASRKNHQNTMEHILGFFKKDLPKDARTQLRTSIQDYKDGYTSLVVPITLLKHYSQLLEVDYLEKQIYLSPHPKKLSLLVKI